MGFDKYTDEELVELSRNGNSLAEEYLLEKYKNLVRGRARSYFLNGGTDEDLIQEGMIGLFKAIRDYSSDKETLFSTFAELCVTRQIITAVKKSTRQKHTPLNNYVSLNKAVDDESPEKTFMDVLLVSEENDPEFMFINQEDKKSAYEVIEGDLSKLEKSVLEMYLEGLSYNEIAEKLDKTTKSIDNALQRLKKKLDGRLKQNKNN